MLNAAVNMANQVIGSIVNLPDDREIRRYDCPQCPEYRRRISTLEKGIRDYLSGYTSRRASEEGAALAELSRLIGYKDIVD